MVGIQWNMWIPSQNPMKPGEPLMKTTIGHVSGVQILDHFKYNNKNNPYKALRFGEPARIPCVFDWNE